MKYIIDIDALKDCLEFVSFANLNGKPAAYLDDVRIFIDRFPKEKADKPNHSNIREVLD